MPITHVVKMLPETSNQRGIKLNFHSEPVMNVGKEHFNHSEHGMKIQFSHWKNQSAAGGHFKAEIHLYDFGFYLRPGQIDSVQIMNHEPVWINGLWCNLQIEQFKVQRRTSSSKLKRRRQRPLRNRSTHPVDSYWINNSLNENLQKPKFWQFKNNRTEKNISLTSTVSL